MRLYNEVSSFYNEEHISLCYPSSVKVFWHHWLECYLYLQFFCNNLIAHYLWSQSFQELMVVNHSVNHVILQSIQIQLLICNFLDYLFRTLLLLSPSIWLCKSTKRKILRHSSSIQIICIFIYDTFRWFIFIIGFYIFIISFTITLRYITYSSS